MATSKKCSVGPADICPFPQATVRPTNRRRKGATCVITSSTYKSSLINKPVSVKSVKQKINKTKSKRSKSDHTQELLVSSEEEEEEIVETVETDDELIETDDDI